MKGLFSTLTISDSPPSDNPGNTPIEGNLGLGGPANVDETVIYTGGSPEFDWNYEQKEMYGSGQFSRR